VWTALNNLQDYLETFFREPWSLSGLSGQINRPLVIHNGEIREDCEIKATGPKSTMQAYFKGDLLDDISIIMPGAYLFDDRIIIGTGTVIEPGALIKGPAVFGDNTEIRQGAYVRGDCLVGDGCVVGHTTEIKGSIMLDGAKAGHFAYIGDSILGKKVNLGAGTKLANLRVIGGTISIKSGRERFDTGRRKLGAIIGDQTETGCNSVTSPGTLLGPGSIVYPCVSVPPGYYPGRTHFMSSQSSLKIIYK
jgi:bifunctional N-acetylglucosamine-1-phosphate-uridyltransferase/glucosamine-1-phosphate-acetyltransferase GlmU-like protein